MLKIWGRKTSTNVQKVLWLVGELRLPFERVDAGGRYGVVGTDGYGKLNPNRRVPIVWKPEDFMIAVGGDPLRNNAYVMASNAFMGYPVGRKIALPANWDALLAAAQDANAD